MCGPMHHNTSCCAACVHTNTHVLHICMCVASKTSVMWASASSDMFSINITKKNNNIENKAEQNKTREGEEVKERMQKKTY